MTEVVDRAETAGSTAQLDPHVIILFGAVHDFCHAGVRSLSSEVLAPMILGTDASGSF